MPVTKKRGAIFAIYADSPVQSTTANTISHSTPSRPSSGPVLSPTKKQQHSTSKIAAAGSSKSVIRPRKALSLVQSKSLAGTGKPGQGADPKGQSTLASEKVVASAPKRGSIVVHADKDENAPARSEPSVNPKSTAKVTTTTKTTKRQIEVLSCPPSPPIQQPSSTISNTGSIGARSPKKSRSIRPTVDSTKTTIRAKRSSVPALPQSPSDPTSFPTQLQAHAEVEVDKENVSPLDSPASRTRSTTRRPTTSAIDVFADPEERTLASPIARKATNATKARLAVLGEGKPGKSKALGAKRAPLGLGVLSVKVLGDVSEAYGAIGDEPEGFKVSPNPTLSGRSRGS